MTAKEAFNKAIRIGKRIPELEPNIMQDGVLAYCYARDVIKDRWLEAEPVIMQDAYWAYCYARDVIKGLWIEAESVIIQDAYYAYFYARDILKERWPEAEPIIMQEARCACYYAIDVIQGRWLEVEQIIAESNWKTHYIKEFFDEPVITKDEVDIIQWDRKKLPGYFAPASLFEDKVSLLDMVIE